MVLLAGINDVARNTGPSTAEMIQQNIMAMTELAQHHGIKVILCSVLPVSDYPYSPATKRAAYYNTSPPGAGGAPPPNQDDRKPPTGRHPEAQRVG